MSNSRPVTPDLPTMEETTEAAVTPDQEATPSNPPLAMVAEPTPTKNESPVTSLSESDEPTNEKETEIEAAAELPEAAHKNEQTTEAAPAIPARVSPFATLNLTLKHLVLAGQDYREKQLNKAIFIDSVFKAIEANRENPENAVRVVQQMVDAKQDEHPEISVMLPGNLYRDISCLRGLKKETILADYDAYINAIKQNPPTCDFDVYLKNRLLVDAGNFFAKLHAYLQANEPAQDSKKCADYERKLGHFAGALIVPLPEVPAQKEGEDPDFAPTGTVEGDAAYSDAIKESLKGYGEKKDNILGTLFGAQKYTGEFKKIIFAALFEEKAEVNIVRHDHKNYLTFLNQVPEKISPFVETLKGEMTYQRQKSGVEFMERIQQQKRQQKK